MIQRMVASALLFLLTVPLMACDIKGLFLDEGNLEKVAAHYYRPGEKKDIIRADQYKFFSAKSKEQVTSDEWVKNQGSFNNWSVTAYKILGNRESKGQRYSIVSVSVDVKVEGNTKRYIWSDTWMLESGKWRRLKFPKIEEETNKAFFGGDLAAAHAKAEEWLLLDPFSVSALNRLGFSIKNLSPLLLKRGGRSMDDILRAMLAINSEDTQVLFSAATLTKDISIAKSFLKKLEGTISYGGTVQNIAIHISDPEKRLSFLSDMPEDEVSIKTIRLLTLYDLRRWDAFREAYEKEGTFEILKASFDKDTTQVASNRAGEIGTACFLSGNKSEAQRWLEYGISKDPNSQQVQKLARLLN